VYKFYAKSIMASRTNVSCKKRNGPWKHLSESSRRNDHEHMCFVNFGSCKIISSFFCFVTKFSLYELTACWAHCSDHVANVLSEINTVKNNSCFVQCFDCRMVVYRCDATASVLPTRQPADHPVSLQDGRQF